MPNSNDSESKLGHYPQVRSSPFVPCRRFPKGFKGSGGACGRGAHLGVQAVDQVLRMVPEAEFPPFKDNVLGARSCATPAFQELMSMSNIKLGHHGNV